MSNTPYLGEIQLFSFGFPPKGWAMCNGQLLPINQNQALFALLGTTYGGNGQTNFALPDLRGRMPMGSSGTHPLGEITGSEAVTLAVSELPAHTHAINISGITATGRLRNAAANQRTPVGTLPAIESTNVLATFSNSPADANMSAAAVAVGGSVTAAAIGGSQPHLNRQPTLTMNYCIALQGIFPSQS